jgi:hypothetical protein
MTPCTFVDCVSILMERPRSENVDDKYVPRGALWQEHAVSISTRSTRVVLKVMSNNFL